MKLWIHGYDDQDVQFILTNINTWDEIIGCSTQQNGISEFPYGGLTQPIQAAIRGEIEQILVSDTSLLGDDPEQIHGLKEIFESYQVSIKSACNADNSNS